MKNTHSNCKLLVLATITVFACAGCSGGSQASVPTASRPTPTIAAAVIPTTNATEPTPDLIIAPAAPQATTPAVAASVPQPPQSAAVPFAYLWPAYLPDGMRVSPNESRIARENEIGTTGTGFYLVTWNKEERKIVVGGGATDALPLAGKKRELDFRNAQATLTTNGEQRQLVFSRDGANFFIYSRNISEAELLLIADSLVPMDVSALREQVKAR